MLAQHIPLVSHAAAVGCGQRRARVICLSLGASWATCSAGSSGTWTLDGGPTALRHDKESNLLCTPYRYVCTMDLHVGSSPRLRRWTQVDENPRSTCSWDAPACTCGPVFHMAIVRWLHFWNVLGHYTVGHGQLSRSSNLPRPIKAQKSPLASNVTLPLLLPDNISAVLPYLAFFAPTIYHIDYRRYQYQILGRGLKGACWADLTLLISSLFDKPMTGNASPRLSRNVSDRLRCSPQTTARTVVMWTCI